VKYLFVHQNFPGQFQYLIKHLVSQQVHEIVFICEPNVNFMNGVRRVTYVLNHPITPGLHPAAQELEFMMARADLVAHRAKTLRDLGFVPDVIIGHHGWGELLHLIDVFPRTPVIGYFEFYYRYAAGDVNFDAEFPIAVEQFPRIRARNNVNHLALTNPGFGQTPTRFQLNTYPEWARRKITVVPEGTYLDRCIPDPAAHRAPFRLDNFQVAPNEKLITFVTRNLEPYRGFHSFMRAMVHVQRARPDVRAILVGGDEVSYGAMPPQGTWREYMLREVGGSLDASRLHFPGKVPYADYLRMLQRSDAHVYLTYPFVASWSLREAMACGCMVVGSDTEPVTEFITDGRTGLIAPMLEPDKLADRILEGLENVPLARRLRAGARRWAEKHLRMEDHIANFEALISRAIETFEGH
jgi:glycosyltransferase involved in cell wall biosynthesis